MRQQRNFGNKMYESMRGESLTMAKKGPCQVCIEGDMRLRDEGPLLVVKSEQKRNGSVELVAGRSDI